ECPHALPPLPAQGARRDPRARPGAPLRLHPSRGGALGLAARDRAHPRAALLEHLPHAAPRMSERAIVVLHGANGCAREMEPLAAPLRAYGRVIVHDLPGHGGRELPDRMSIEGSAADVIARLDREGIGRAFIVGYSLGGYLAVYLARHHPARVLGACGLGVKYLF